jgi:hypothetical protein
LVDGFVKSPISALCCILRHCSAQPSAPHSSGFARLELGTFYFAIPSTTFYGFILVASFPKKHGNAEDYLSFAKMFMP